MGIKRYGGLLVIAVQLVILVLSRTSGDSLVNGRLGVRAQRPLALGFVELARFDVDRWLARTSPAIYLLERTGR